MNDDDDDDGEYADDDDVCGDGAEVNDDGCYAVVFIDDDCVETDDFDR